MTTRAMQFFAREQEFLDILNEILICMELYPLYHLRTSNPTIMTINKPLTLNEIRKLEINDIYLSDFSPEINLLDPKTIYPGYFGWISVTFPREDPNALFLGVLSFKSTYKDPQTGLSCENPSCLKFFKRVSMRLEKHLKFGMWVYNTNNAASEYYKGLGYTESAKKFSESGGQLMQKGVPYTRFFCNLPRENYKL